MESTWENVIKAAENVTGNELAKAEAAVEKHDIVNIQFTSGTTGSPKAAMLTHLYVVILPLMWTRCRYRLI